jgi:hypothetical protein
VKTFINTNRRVRCLLTAEVARRLSLAWFALPQAGITLNKVFTARFSGLEDEFFRDDGRVADQAIEYAEEWYKFGKEILVTKGTVME